MDTRIRGAAALLAAAAFLGLYACGSTLPQSGGAREVPRFEADPSWPKLPDKWVWGQVSSVAFDERDHAWILQRPGSIRTDQKGRAAPPVME